MRRHRRGSRWRGFSPPHKAFLGLFLDPFGGFFQTLFGPLIKEGPTLTTNHLLFISICNLSLVSSLWALIFIQYLLFIEKYIYRSHLYPTLWLNFRRQPNFHIRDRRLADAGIANQSRNSNQCRNSKSKQE